uniref:Uncharacterized protein n=1 Tax=Prymnesium polylepis TaxID=72548 RepID=A0A6T8AI44_9EUKA
MNHQQAAPHTPTRKRPAASVLVDRLDKLQSLEKRAHEITNEAGDGELDRRMLTHAKIVQKMRVPRQFVAETAVLMNELMDARESLTAPRTPASGSSPLGRDVEMSDAHAEEMPTTPRVCLDGRSRVPVTIATCHRQIDVLGDHEIRVRRTRHEGLHPVEVTKEAVLP